MAGRTTKNLSLEKSGRWNPTNSLSQVNATESHIYIYIYIMPSTQPSHYFDRVHHPFLASLWKKRMQDNANWRKQCDPSPRPLVAVTLASAEAPALEFHLSACWVNPAPTGGCGKFVSSFQAHRCFPSRNSYRCRPLPVPVSPSNP